MSICDRCVHDKVCVLKGEHKDIAFCSEITPKTGHWEKTIEGHCYWYKCSCCGTKVPKNEWGNDYFSPYCPNCGVKMESE